MASNDLTREELQEILEWAAGAAGMSFLLHFAAQPESTDELVTKVMALEYGIDKMISVMPPRLSKLGMKLAQECAEEVAEEEEAVSEFMAEVDKLL